jgi:transcriptional regulator with XRE-family HTH domain
MIFTSSHQDFESGADSDLLQGHPSLDRVAVEILVRLDESSPLRDQLAALKTDLGFRDRELMRLAGVSRATLSRWRREGDAERPPEIDDLRAIVALLIRCGAMRPRSVAGWVRSRNRGLNDQRPLEALAAGEFRRVMKAAEAACGARLPVNLPEDSEATPSFQNAAAGDSGGFGADSA